MIQLVSQVLESMLINVITPAMARTGDVDRVVDILKKSVVTYAAERTDEGKETLARHFSKSNRWVYRFLAEQRKEIEDGPPEPTVDSLINMIMNIYYQAYPRELTPKECAEEIKARGRRGVSAAVVEPLLNVYTDLGLLKRTERRPAKYQAAGRVYELNAKGTDARIERLGQRCQAILPIAVSYGRGDEGASFGLGQGRLMQKHWEVAVRDCRSYFMRRFNEALEASRLEDPDEEMEGEWIDWLALFLTGLGSIEDIKKP